MDLLIQTLTTVSYAVVSPDLALMLLSLGILFYFKNRKIAFMQRLIMGESIHSPLELTISQIVLGIIGGVLASIILSFLGVTFYDNSGVEFIFIASIIGFMYKPRYFNFPYLGAALGIVSIIMDYIYKINGINSILHIEIVCLGVLIGVISFVQGLLIIIDGQKGYVPVFTNREGKILGGFAFKRYWTLPIAFFVIMTSLKDSQIRNTLAISNYFPLINFKDIIFLLSTTVISMVPLYGFVGYEAVTFTRNRREKITVSGLLLCLYGILICLICQIARINVFMKLIVIILIPILYELIKYIDKKLEDKREALFISNDDGICILDVIPHSLAYKQGVKSGYRILEVNGEKPLTESEVFKAIRENYYGLTLKVKTLDGEILEYKIDPNIKRERFGVILVPRYPKDKYTMDEIMQKLKKVRNRN